MNILLLCHEYPPGSNGRGVHTDELARGLLARGHSVAVLAAATHELRDADLPPWVHPVLEPESNRITDFESYRQPYTRNIYDLAARLHAERPFDLVHTHDWYSAEAGIRLTQAWDVPSVATIHLFPKPIDIWQPRLCDASDVVIAVSHSIRNEALTKYQLAPSKVKMVYNAVDPATLTTAATRDDLLQQPAYQFLADPSLKLVLLSGRIHPQKGIDMLLQSIPEVLQQIDRVHWVVCGGGGIAEQVLPRYAPLIDRYQHAITFTGHVPRHEALGWKRLADVVVAPSRYEPFGLSVLEAMLLGKAVIVADVDGLSELVVAGESGLKLPLDQATPDGSAVSPSALAQAQIRLLQDEALAQRLGHTAQQYANLSFSYPRFIEQTLEVYQSARA